MARPKEDDPFSPFPLRTSGFHSTSDHPRSALTIHMSSPSSDCDSRLPSICDCAAQEPLLRGFDSIPQDFEPEGGSAHPFMAVSKGAKPGGVNGKRGD